MVYKYSHRPLLIDAIDDSILEKNCDYYHSHNEVYFYYSARKYNWI